MSDFYDFDFRRLFDEYEEDAAGTVICRFCDEMGLHWAQVERQQAQTWRLFDDDGAEHVCTGLQRHQPSEDDFDDLGEQA